MFRASGRLRLATHVGLGLRRSSTVVASRTRSPKDYVIGQDRAKKIMSVAVYNHFRRIAPLIAPSPDAEAAQKAPSTPLEWEQPPPMFETDFATSNPSRDAASVVGAENGSDPTLTHSGDALSREEKWARGDGYFSARRPPRPTLLGKLGKRQRESDLVSAAALDRPLDSMSSRRRSQADEGKEARRQEEDARQEARQDARRQEDARCQEEEARRKRVAELNEVTRNKLPKEDPAVVVEKSNVLMVGPTGTGKTLISKTLARALDVPFVSCDATTYTQAGYVGEDVESCILRLLQAADYDIARAEIGIVHIDEVDKLARRGGNEYGTWGGGRDVGGEGVQQALLRLLEGTTVTLQAKSPPITSTPASSSAPGSAGAGSTPSSPKSDLGGGWEWDPNNPMNRSFGNAPGKKSVREGLPGYSGGGPTTANKGDTFVVDTSNILFILSGAFVGLDDIITKRLGKGSIGFGAPLSAAVPAGSMKATTSDLKDYGLIPEFLGRLPVLSMLHPLAIDDLIRILTEPRNALIKQYKTLFIRYGAELEFTRFGLEAIAQEGLDRGGGARGLRGVLEEVLVDAMFEVPGSGVRHCLVTAATVTERQPAQYFSRGQRHLLEAAMEAESGRPKARAVPRLDDFVGEPMRAVG